MIQHLLDLNASSTRGGSWRHRERFAEAGHRAYDALADLIQTQVRPRSVLDIGSPAGSLLCALRQRNIDAWHLDTRTDHVNDPSELFAFSRPALIDEPLGRHYDLIVLNIDPNWSSADDAARAAANIVRHTSDVIICGSADQSSGAAPISARWLAACVEQFAPHGFFRDLDFCPAFRWPRMIRVRRAVASALPAVVRSYEDQHWRLQEELYARRQLALDQAHDLASLTARLERSASLPTAQASPPVSRLQFAHRMAQLRQKLAHTKARFRRAVHLGNRAWQVYRAEGWNELQMRLRDRLTGRAPTPRPLPAIHPDRFPELAWNIVPTAAVPESIPRQSTVDVIFIAEGNRHCIESSLEAIRENTSSPYRLTIVDHTLDWRTSQFLEMWSAVHRANVLSESSCEADCSCAAAIERSRAEFIAIVESGSRVPHGWLDRLVACAQSDPRIGVLRSVTTADMQRLADVGISTTGIGGEVSGKPDSTQNSAARSVAHASARLYPTLDRDNATGPAGVRFLRREFCTQFASTEDAQSGADRSLIDLVSGAEANGWRAVLADDVLVDCSKQRAATCATAASASKTAGARLQHPLSELDRVLAGTMVRASVASERQELIEQGRSEYGGLRLLFVLPITLPGGGGNIVMLEAAAMRRMGVDVALVNVPAHRAAFERAYPDLKLPVYYAEPHELSLVAAGYDAVVATVHHTVRWLEPLGGLQRRPLRAYYVQDFEPYFYSQGTPEFQLAWDSYALLDDLVRFTKTEWNRREVRQQIGVDCHTVGPSVDLDLFRPRPRASKPGDRPVRIAALVRPETPRRAPEWTMQLLRQTVLRWDRRVEIIAFGASIEEMAAHHIPMDFDFKCAGVLSPQQAACLMNEIDILADFSTYQAMGLTALEAMACGAAVICPAAGGSASFARDGVNSLVVDSHSADSCLEAIDRLVDDEALRTRLAKQALHDVCQHYPERAAWNTLQALFASTTD